MCCRCNIAIDLTPERLESAGLNGQLKRQVLLVSGLIIVAEHVCVNAT
jgi:hypothetical protein